MLKKGLPGETGLPGNNGEDGLDGYKGIKGEPADELYEDNLIGYDGYVEI